jgi:xeroderma pigmentosum group C-complementing protein
MSNGDPLLRLLKVLAAYWRKRFTVTAPALRKRGFMPLRRLRDEIKHWDSHRDDAEEHGERIADIIAFRKLARRCEGSRDVGGQLFVALLRGIGLETRMVANLQPAGIGWSKSEEADEKRLVKDKKTDGNAQAVAEGETIKTPAKTLKSRQSKNEEPQRKSTRGNKNEPIKLDDSESPLSEPPSDDDPTSIRDEADDSDASLIDVTSIAPKKKVVKRYDRDLAFPTYWTEVCSPISNKWIPVDPIVLATIASNDDLLQTFEPRGKKAESAKQVICYVIGFSADGTAKDVTVRYLKKHQFPGKTKGVRMPAERVPIYNKRGKVKKYEDYDWFRTVMSIYDRPQPKRTVADDLEEQTDLKPFKAAEKEKEVDKESLQFYKHSAEFVLEQHLRREEALLPRAQPVKTFTTGKGDKSKDYPVYRRSDVAVCKTVESWHKEGRAVRVGEHPMKHVPVRAVTLIRKREMEEHLKEHGEKLQQGLYSWDQTDWIIPPPIENGVIPKNAFGNMDVYVPTMVPKGGVHLPLKGSAKICRKLGIDYAEACTGFEFGKQRAVPVLTGVVVAEEHEILVRDAWKEEQQEIKRKEDTKRTATALHWWRKMVMGMRIIQRMQAEYDQASGDPDEINPFARKAKTEERDSTAGNFDDEAGAGGFFRPGHNEEEVPQRKPDAIGKQDDTGQGGGFFAESEDEVQADDAGGGFLVEDAPDDEILNAQDRVFVGTVASAPVSLQALHQRTTESDHGEQHDTKADKGRSTKNSKPKDTRPPVKRGSERVMAPDSSDFEMSDADATPPVPSSPQVVVTRRGGRAPPVSRPSRGRATKRAAKKTTPIESQYFVTKKGAVDDEDDDEGDVSEPEVSKPTRTTARTRSKK